MPTIVVSTVGSDVSRDYANLVDWDNDFGTGLSGDLVLDDEVHIAEVHNDNGAGNAALTGNPLINNTATVSATNYQMVAAVAGSEFDPGDPASITNHSGIYFSHTGGVMRISVSHFRVRHIGFISTNSGAGFLRCCRFNNPDGWIDACYFEMLGGTNDNNRGLDNNSSGDLTATNCIARGADVDGSGTGSGLRFGFYNGSTGDLIAWNCGAYRINNNEDGAFPLNTRGTGFFVNTAGSDVRNCWAFECGEDGFDVSGGATFSHCAADDATPTGTGALTNQVVGDFLGRPAQGGYALDAESNGINAGTDLSSVWPDTSAVEDFLNLDHDGDGNGWEIGPFRRNTLSDDASDTVVITEAALRALTMARSADDTETITEAVAALVALARATDDTVSLAEAVFAALAKLRNADDVEAITEEALTVFGRARNSDDIETITEEVFVTLGFIRAIDDTEDITEAVGRALAIARAVSEEVAITDEAVRALGLARSVDELVAISDEALTARGLARVVEEVEAITEEALAARGLARSIAEVETVSELVGFVLGMARAVADTVTITETVHFFLGGGVQSTDDSVAITELVGIALCVVAPEGTALDSRLINTVATLIGRLGKSAVFDGVHAHKVSPPDNFAHLLDVEDVFEVGTSRVLLPTRDIAFTPSRGMRVTYDGAEWQIDELQPIASGEKVALWIIGLRGDPTAPSPSTAETTLDERLVPTVFSIIDRLGKTIELDGGAATVKATPPDAYRVRFAPSDVIAQGNVRTFVPASGLGVTPSPGMEVAFDGTSSEIVSARRIYTGEQVALWQIDARGVTLPTSPSSETALDERLVPRVLSLVQRIGAEAIFHVETRGAYDHELGFAPVASQAVYRVRVTPPDQSRKGFATEDVLKKDDSRIFVPASGLAFDPFLALRACVLGEWRKVVGVEPILTGEQVALYALTLRRF